MYEVTSPTNSGRVIAVWSPVSRQGGTSTLASLIAAYLCRTNQNDKVLVMSNETDGQPTAEQYLVKDKAVSGLAEVIELAISDNLHSPDDLYNNAHNIASNLDGLSCDKGNTNVADFLSREIEQILDLARRSYKFTVVDTISGQYDTTTQEILKNCDCIVVGLPQDKYIFDNWVRKMPNIYPSYLNGDKTVLVASSYFDYSHMRYQDLRKELKGIPLYYVNQNSAVHKAVSYRSMLDFISSELKLKKGYDEVVDEIGAIVDRVETLLIEVVNKEVEAEAKAAEEREQENKDYIENHVGFYSDTMYGDEDTKDGLDDMDEDFGVYSSVEDSSSPSDSMYNIPQDEDSDGIAKQIKNETQEAKGTSINLEKEPSQLTEEDSTGFEGFGADDLYN